MMRTTIKDLPMSEYETISIIATEKTTITMMLDNKIYSITTPKTKTWKDIKVGSKLRIQRINYGDKSQYSRLVIVNQLEGSVSVNILIPDSFLDEPTIELLGQLLMDKIKKDGLVK